MHVNCRSISKNIDVLTTLLNITSSLYSSIAISETWFAPDTEDCFAIRGYTFVSSSRSLRGGGGVGIYINNNFPFIVRSDLKLF